MPTERRLIRRRRKKVDARRRVDRRVAELAAEEWGVLSVRELRGLGLSDVAVARREDRGFLHRLHQGVYAVGHAGLTKEGFWLAAVKACGHDAVLTHYSGSALWRFVTWDDRDPEVPVPGPGTRVHPGIRVHRSACLDRRDVMIRDGIRVTTPARTLLDLASIVPYATLRRAVREAMAERRVAIPALVEVLARCGPRRGSRNLARIVADGYTPTASVLEDIVLELILAGGFERPDVNRPLVIEGRRVVPDFRWPKQRIIVEADGGQWHDHKLAREDDVERQAFLEAHGETVIRVTWDQAVTKRSQTQRRLAAAGAPLR
jgi:very-short-patch-repair endonuclease